MYTPVLRVMLTLLLIVGGGKIYKTNLHRYLWSTDFFIVVFDKIPPSTSLL